MIDGALAHRVTVQVHIFTLILLQDLLVPPVIELYELEVLDEVEILHRLDHVLPVYRLPLLLLRDLATLARDEGYEFTDALLDAFSGLLGNFRVAWQGVFHDSVNVGDWQEPFLICELLLLGCRLLIRSLGGDVRCRIAIALRHCRWLQFFNHASLSEVDYGGCS